MTTLENTGTQNSSDRLKQFEEKMERELDNIRRTNYENQNFAKSLQRRSSFEKIKYICNQSYSAFPHVFIWLQDFQQTFDFNKMIPLIRSMFLAAGVYLGIALLLAQFIFCLIVTFKLATPTGLIFLLVCVGFLGVLALKSFVVANDDCKFRQRTLSLSKKIQ